VGYDVVAAVRLWLRLACGGVSHVARVMTLAVQWPRTGQNKEEPGSSRQNRHVGGFPQMNE
jgi:hypothetical protein